MNKTISLVSIYCTINDSNTGANVIEDGPRLLDLAGKIDYAVSSLGIPWVFKASWDKANRTSVHSYRGVGLDQGLKCLQNVKTAFNVPIITDVHETIHVDAVAEVADIVQIPSFLCRQTDLITTSAKTGRIVLIKKGQYASSAVMAQAVRKVHSEGNLHAMVCERGTSYGASDLVFDPRQILSMQTECLGAPVVMDATHSCQIPPSGVLESSRGNRDLVAHYARIAAVLSVDGMFIECHQDPEKAPVDSLVQWPVENLHVLLEELLSISMMVHSFKKQ